MHTATYHFLFWKYGTAACNILFPVLQVWQCTVQSITSNLGSGDLQSATYHFRFSKCGNAVCSALFPESEMITNRFTPDFAET